MSSSFQIIRKEMEGVETRGETRGAMTDHSNLSCAPLPLSSVLATLGLTKSECPTMVEEELASAASASLASSRDDDSEKTSEEEPTLEVSQRSQSLPVEDVGPAGVNPKVEAISEGENEAGSPPTSPRLTEDDMEQFNKVFHQTLKTVGGYAKLCVGDIVLTPFGEGKIMLIGDDESTKIALPWGILCTRLPNIHRRLPTADFQEAMDHLDELRKLQLAVQCQKWSVSLKTDVCVACLLRRPDYKVKKQQKSKWGRLRDSMGSNKNRQLWECDVCGNPVCKAHDRQQQKGGGDNFHMCVDCAFDLDQVEHQLNAYHPHVLQNLERLLLLYTRMCLQFSFWLPYIPELCNQIFRKQRKNAKISLGTTGLGFVGAALGVAGAATMLTPVGPAILIAAMATSATSGTLQATHQGYDKYFSSKVVHEISDRLIAWHGLCCGIIQSLEQLRQDLLAEQMMYTTNSKFGLFKSKDQSSNQLWKTLSVGSMSMSRSAFTGVGVTSAMGATYAQVINTSLLTVPVVGAAFSVTYMAMDAGNIYSHLQELKTPNSYIIKLKHLQHAQSHVHYQLPHVQTLESEVDLLGNAVRDLNSKLEQLRQEQDLEYHASKYEKQGETESITKEPIPESIEEQATEV